MAVILIAEDEKEMQTILAETLKREGHTCISADDGIDAITFLKNNPIDLLILDIMMPHLDGFTICKLVQEMYDNIPIIFLTAKSSEEDKLKGYEYGADDYITKPFSTKLLLAKVNALLRRSGMTPKNALHIGEIVLQPSSRTVSVNGEEIDLTHKEFELLHFFMQNKNQVFAREQLLNRIWGYDYDGNTRTVDTHIKTLRQKLGQEGRYIVTLIRSGYKFEV
jgi:DNA-binding response OmpR family regulator